MRSRRKSRFLRGFGTAMLIIASVLAALRLFALLGAKPERRWNIGKASVFLGFVAAAAQGLRRYRRIDNRL